LSKPIAVVVEDDLSFLEGVREYLVSLDFELREFHDVSSAQGYISSTHDLIDLFVLDRQLPISEGGPASGEVGDLLLTEVRQAFPRVRLFVFTGYATVEHAQQAYEGAGRILENTPHATDVVTVRTKSQSLEFEEDVRKYRALLQRLDNIEIQRWTGADPFDSFETRLLRRVAFHYSADSITPIPLAGGLTGAKVWRCEIKKRDAGTMNVVVKTSEVRSPSGGLQGMLPPGIVTATLDQFNDLTGKWHVSVLQLAGQTPEALMDQIGQDPAGALERVQPVFQALGSVSEVETVVSLEELCAPLIQWDKLTDILRVHSISPPSKGLRVTTKLGLRHGDLHPGNILVDAGFARLIDLDSTCMASCLLDPVTVLLSTLTHPGSPIKGHYWPDESAISEDLGTDAFGHGHGSEAWFSGAWAWTQERTSSSREFWGIVLAYSARQLKYGDVLDDADALIRVRALTMRAVQELP